VTLDAQQSAITQDGDSLVDLFADQVVADAKGGIHLDTHIRTLDGSTSAAGDIRVAEVDDIELSDVDTANGAITVTAGGAIEAIDIDSSQTDDDSNDITLISAGGVGAIVRVHLVVAGVQNDVRLEAHGTWWAMIWSS
jgi:hypothetical protein